jgi:hypothetical protein
MSPPRPLKPSTKTGRDEGPPELLLLPPDGLDLTSPEQVSRARRQALEAIRRDAARRRAGGPR